MLRLARALLAPLLMLVVAHCVSDATEVRARPPICKPRKRCVPPTTTTAVTDPPTTTDPSTSTDPPTTAEATTTEPPTTVAETSTTAAPTTTAAATTTTVAPVAPAQGAVPPISAVGPRASNLIVNPATTLGPGTYNGQRLGRVTPQGCGTYTFTDSELDGFQAGYPCVRLVLLHSKVNSGLWFEGGSQDGAEIRWSIIDGGSRQALRPKGAGTMLVEDSWLLTHGTELDQNIHTETVQGLEGAGGTFDRVAFSIEPVGVCGQFTPITAVVNVDGPFLFRDVVLGYWTGSAWSAGGGCYAAYPGPSSVWQRPTIYHGGAGYFYPPAPTGDRLVDPTYR